MVKEALTISQTLSDSDKNLDLSKPYIGHLAWKRDGYTGQITLGLGAKTVAVTATTESGWQQLVFAMDKDCWYRQFKQDNPKVSIAVTWTGGTALYLDTVIIKPMTYFDGTWFAVIGSNDDFHEQDRITFTDSWTATDAVIQKWIYRAYGRHIPHTGSPSITDPTIG